jgi:hypothetical protein
MNTIIHDDIEVPEEAQDVAKRVALKENCTIGDVFARWLLDKAREINSGVHGRKVKPKKVAA